MPFVGDYTESILTLGGIWAIAAVGLQITLASGQFSVMHAALVGVGAYTAGITAAEFGASFPVTVLAAVGVTAVLGGIASVATLRLVGFLVAIATLAVGQALRIIVTNVDFFGGSLGYSGVPFRTSFLSVVIALAVVLFIASRLRRSQDGLGSVAVGQDEAAALSLGISVTRTKIWAFMLGAGIAGCAGALYIQNISLVTPRNLGFQFEIQLLFFVIIGGMTTPWGAAFGAMAFTFIPEFLRFATLDRFWILGLILVAVMLVKPKGLLTRRPVDREPFWRVQSFQEVVGRWRARLGRAPTPEGQ